MTNKIKRKAAVLVMFVCAASALAAAEFEDGRIKYVLDQSTGRFSLYYMTDVDRRVYEPLIWDRDKKTSFFSVSLDGTEYRMGSSSRFKMYLRGTEIKPALVFESPMIAITQEFSFIRTASSGVSNGIRIDIKIENWGEKTVNVGARLLVDSFLGESANPNFRTDLRPIESELMIDASSRDQWWVSRNNKYGLMGSVFVEGIDPPTALHFANWKRLYDAPFKAEYVPTRNFNSMPFSIRDSAVCYYLDVMPLERWQTRNFTVLLAADDKYGFDVKKFTTAIIEKIVNGHVESIEVVPERNNTNQIAINAPAAGGGNSAVGTQQQAQNPDSPFVLTPYGRAVTPVTPVAPLGPPAGGRGGAIMLPIGPIRVDLMTLRELIYKVDEYIYFGTAISEEELRGMEMAITRLKSRYGGIISPYR